MQAKEYALYKGEELIAMDDVKECYFTDKEKALERMEILKDLSMAVDDATVWMEEIDD